MAITTTNQLLPEIVVPLDAEERKFNLQFDLSSARESDPPKELKVIPEDCGSSDAMSREIVQLLNEQIGILSLSRVRDSLLMWSHYGDQYAGAVVGFVCSFSDFWTKC